MVVQINGASGTCGARSIARNVLDFLVQSRRNAVGAKKFVRRLLKGLRCVPRGIVTDKLASYKVAHRELMASVQHRRSRYLNNRAENSNQPTRQRERAMKRFSRSGTRNDSCPRYGISPHFRPRRHLVSAADYRKVMADHFAVWNEITGARPRPPPESATGTRRLVQATAHHPESSHRPVRLAQVDNALLTAARQVSPLP